MRTALALLIVSGMAAFAVPASAETYDVWSCRQPSGLPAGTAGWRHVSQWAPPPSDDCALSRGLSVDLGPFAVPQGATTGWWFDAPPDTTIASYELHRSARVAG